MSDLWRIRSYDEAIDINGVLYLYLKSFAHSSFGRARGAQVDGSDGERTYWAYHRKVFEHLLKSAETRVLCDPEEPSVIWAVATTSGEDVVHYCVVKRKFKEFAADMFRALLGDRLDRPCTYTHCLQGTGVLVPASWCLNPYRVLT